MLLTLLLLVLQAISPPTSPHNHGVVLRDVLIRAVEKLRKNQQTLQKNPGADAIADRREQEELNLQSQPALTEKATIQSDNEMQDDKRPTPGQDSITENNPVQMQNTDKNGDGK